jgi:hypothetical protein
MIRSIRARVSYANVTSTLALLVALGTGSAYAANEWTGENIVNGSLTAVDLAVGTIGTGRIQDESLQAIDLKADSVTASEIAAGAVGTDEIGTNAVGASEIADNTVDGGEIVDNSVFAADIAAGGVGASEIAAGAVGRSEVVDNVLTGEDLAGADVHGSISLPAGAVANGRCKDYVSPNAGAVTGDAVIFSMDGALPEGVLIYGVRVPSNGNVTVKVCNLSGGAMPAITNLPVSVFTITL